MTQKHNGSIWRVGSLKHNSLGIIGENTKLKKWGNIDKILKFCKNIPSLWLCWECQNLKGERCCKNYMILLRKKKKRGKNQNRTLTYICIYVCVYIYVSTHIYKYIYKQITILAIHWIKSFQVYLPYCHPFRKEESLSKPLPYLPTSTLLKEEIENPPPNAPGPLLSLLDILVLGNADLNYFPFQ